MSPVSENQGPIFTQCGSSAQTPAMFNVKTSHKTMKIIFFLEQIPK